MTRCGGGEMEHDTGVRTTDVSTAVYKAPKDGALNCIVEYSLRASPLAGGSKYPK